MTKQSKDKRIHELESQLRDLQQMYNAVEEHNKHLLQKLYEYKVRDGVYNVAEGC